MYKKLNIKMFGEFLTLGFYTRMEPAVKTKPAFNCS